MKAAGVNVPDETVKALETILPQIPGKINEMIEGNITYLKYFQNELAEIKRNQQLIMQKLGIDSLQETTAGKRLSPSTTQPQQQG